MAKFSTRYKVAAGYILLTLLLTATMGYIYHGMRQMTDSGEFDSQISARRAITNEVMNELNKAEIIVQTIAIGNTGEYNNYKRVMSHVDMAVDSLKRLTTDSVNSVRLDSVTLLLRQKESNMRKLMKIINSNDIEKIYRKEIEEMIMLQDSLLTLNHTKQTVIMHTRREVLPKKRKSFFKRFREAFAPPKDSTVINDTIYEVYTDSLRNAHAIADTLTDYLRNVQLRMSDSRRQQVQKLETLMRSIRISSLMLNENVRQLLTAIEDEDRSWAQEQREEQEMMRNKAAWTISGIAVISVILAGAFMFFIWRDIARSNHYRKELEKAKQHAEELLEAREKLMLTITHDIKAPVGSILGHVELLDNITAGERQKFYLQNLQKSAEHLLQLVNSLLDFHRLDADKMEQQSVSFNAKELFDSIVESYRPQAEAKYLNLTSNCNDALNDLFIGDPLRIRQITENLVGNAMKFTDNGEIAINAELEENVVHISVSDTGCGIAAEDMERLFKEFTRLENAQGKEGFGLGLAITNKLVHLLGGSIEVESKKGKGTKFDVRLPLERTEAEAIESKKQETAIKIIPARILLIDDDPLQTAMMEGMLNHPTTTVVSCNHPDELFIHLQQQRFDIIITDIQMPAMNGIELIKKIRATEGCSNIPVIAITARGDMNTENLAAQGFALCINKPFTSKELLQGVAKATDERICYQEELPNTERKEVKECIKADFSQLTAFSMGDTEATENIMKTFISETKKKHTLLIEAKERRDIQAATSVTHQLLPVFVMTGTEPGKEELEWFETKRTETIYTNEADEKLNIVLIYTDRIIKEAEREFFK